MPISLPVSSRPASTARRRGAFRCASRGRSTRSRRRRARPRRGSARRSDRSSTTSLAGSRPIDRRSPSKTTRWTPITGSSPDATRVSWPARKRSLWLPISIESPGSSAPALAAEPLAVQVRPVARAEIVDHEAAVAAADPGVMSRGALVGEDDVVVIGSPQRQLVVEGDAPPGMKHGHLGDRGRREAVCGRQCAGVLAVACASAHASARPPARRAWARSDPSPPTRWE